MDTKLQREIEVMRMKKKVVVALGHRALGTTLPEQQIAVRKTVKSIADLVQDGYQVVITHSNAPQLGMIHTAMNEFGKNHPDYTPAVSDTHLDVYKIQYLLFLGIFIFSPHAFSITSFIMSIPVDKGTRCVVIKSPPILAPSSIILGPS